MTAYSIYCLKDPDSGEIRYFGQTCNKIQRRFSQHLSAPPKWHVSRWVQYLRREDKLPVCEVLMRGLEKWEADEEEIALIAWGKSKGLRLTNLTNGGDGMLGFEASEQVKKKISLSKRGRKKSTNTSGYVGIYLDKGLWVARIQRNNKKIYLGHFSNKEAAARAYDSAAIQFDGDSAQLNFSAHNL